MTVQISFEKTVKILRLYFDGVPQEKIARITKVAQSTVAETISRFKEDVRKYGLEAASEKYGIYEQIESLSSLSVELRKSKIVVEEAKNGAKLLLEISELGVNPSEIKSFLRVCKEAKNKNFLHAAIKLADLQERNNLDYDKALIEYQNKVVQSKRLNTDIEQLKTTKARLDSDTENLEKSFKKRFHDCNLTIGKLNYILEIIPQELRKNGLNSQETKELLKEICDSGGLSEYLKIARRKKACIDNQINEIRNTRDVLQKNVENLYETRNTYTIQIEGKESEINGLTMGIKYAEKKLAQLAVVEERKKENITATRAILSFLASNDPNAWHIDDIIITLQCAKTAKSIGMGEQSIKLTESARKKLVRHILPLVENELVSKTLLDSRENDINALKQEIDNNYVPRSELDATKTELENVKIRFDQLEELSKDSRRLYEDKINQIEELLKNFKKYYEDIINGLEISNKQKDETIKKVTSERGELQRKLTDLINSVKMPILWYKLNIKPENLTDAELTELVKILEGVKLKRLPVKFIKDFLDRLFFRK